MKNIYYIVTSWEEDKMRNFETKQEAVEYYNIFKGHKRLERANFREGTARVIKEEY